nr:hypothetical protein [Tanacetum cinerariifolium]
MVEKELVLKIRDILKKEKDLRQTLYDEKVIGLGYTSMILAHSDEALQIEKFKRSRENKIEFAYDYGNLNAIILILRIINPDFDKIDSPFQQTSSLKPYVPNVILEKIIINFEDEVVNLLEKEKVNLETIKFLKSKSFESSEKVSSESENKIEFAYDYGNLNASYVNEKINFKHDYFQDIINPYFKKIDSPFQQTSSLNPFVLNVVLENIIIDLENEVETPKVIAHRKFKLNVSQCALPISMSKSSCESNYVEIKLKRKRHLDTFSSVRRPKHSSVIWKKKGSSNTSNVGIEVAFRKSICFVRNEDGVDLLTGDRSSNLYTVALNEVASNSSTYLLAKASSSQSWFWHQRLSHLKFATINKLMKNNLVQGLPKMKFEKIICVPVVNKRRFIGNITSPKWLLLQTIVVDDYSRYSRVFFLHSKDEASKVIISFIKKTQVNLQHQVQRVRTNNGTEFKNKTLAKFFEEVGITQQFFAARTPQQNGVMERRNRTLVKAARTMLTFANLPSFL